MCVSVARGWGRCWPSLVTTRRALARRWGLGSEGLSIALTGVPAPIRCDLTSSTAPPPRCTRPACRRSCRTSTAVASGRNKFASHWPLRCAYARAKPLQPCTIDFVACAHFPACRRSWSASAVRTSGTRSTTTRASCSRTTGRYAGGRRPVCCYRGWCAGGGGEEQGSHSWSGGGWGGGVHTPFALMSARLRNCRRGPGLHTSATAKLGDCRQRSCGSLHGSKAAPQTFGTLPLHTSPALMP